MPEKPHRFLTAETLAEVRRHTDWPALLAALGIAVDPRRSRPGEVWAHSPFSEDETASFHLTDQGWYCFATGTGGGALELVQQVRRQREGVTIDCYAAARWLIESGLSRAPGEEPLPREPSPAPPPRVRAEKAPNRPIL